MKFILEHPDYEWDWDVISESDIITPNDMISHPELPWKYNDINDPSIDLHLKLILLGYTYRNTKSKGRIYLSEIPRTHILLLTATPINNKLTDLFSLADIVYPGLLETESSFVSRYAEDSKCRIVRSDTVKDLRNKLAQIMCRTRRIETDIPFTKRFVETRRIEANADEMEFIDKSTDFLKDLCNNKFKTVEELKIQNPTKKEVSEAQSNAILIFQAISIQQSISSSPKAAIETFQKRYAAHRGPR